MQDTLRARCLRGAPRQRTPGQSQPDPRQTLMNKIDTIAFDQALVGIADQEIVILEARIRAAQLSADLTALQDLISDDLLFTGPDGQLGTKEQDIEAYRSGTVRFIAHVPEELRIRRLSADVAITSLRAQLTVDFA